jgi:hypothetical protein
MKTKTQLGIFYTTITNQFGVISAGVIAWMQSLVDAGLPIVQFVIAAGTAILVLFNVVLKGMEILERVRGNKSSSEDDDPEEESS